MSLKGKVAVITGGSGGIGAEIAGHLARLDARTIVTFATNEAGAQAVVRHIKDHGGDAIAVKTDVRRRADVTGLFQQVAETWGGTDILINNAGVDPRVPLLDMTESDWDHVIDTNLKGVFLCSQAAARQMMERGSGKIVNISSVHGHATDVMLSAYAASKGGVNMLTKQLSLELTPHNIQVNAVAPGAIEVEKYFTQFPGYDRDEIGAQIPAGRIGEVTDVAPLVAFLCGRESDFITGQIISVDGGTTAKLAL